MTQYSNNSTLYQQIATLCAQLAHDLKSGKPTRIEDLLAGWQGDERNELLRQLLAVEIDTRRARHEEPRLDEFAGRFPDDAPLVQIVFDQSEATIAATHLNTGSTSPQEFGEYKVLEQSADAHTADVRSDIYSLGCTLYFLLTSDAVYGGATLFNRMLAHRDKPTPSLTAARPDNPPAVDDLFHKIVAKQPSDRCLSSLRRR